jgi:hypothetical protein
MNQVIRVTGEPPTWRHTALRVIWVIIILPVGLLICAAAIAAWLIDTTEGWWRGLHRWANPVNTGRVARLHDYLHADEESVTQPYPPDYGWHNHNESSSGETG